MIFLVYVHGECQSDPCKIKEIWVKLEADVKKLAAKCHN